MERVVGHPSPNVVIYASATPIPASYDSSPGSLIFNNLGKNNANFLIWSLTNEGLYVSVDGMNDNFFVPGSGTFVNLFVPNVLISPSFRIRSAQPSAITAGTVNISMWG